MRAFRMTSLAAIATAAAVAVFGVQAVRADTPVGPGPLAAAPSAASLAAERLLRAAATAPLTITRDADGLAHLLGTSAGHPLALPAGGLPGAAPAGQRSASSAGAEAQARAHLARSAALFGLADPATELRLVPQHDALATVATGGLPGATDRILRFQQRRHGMPVLGGELVVVLDAAGALRSITGEALPSVTGAASSPGPVTAAAAERAALAAVTREHPKVADALRASKPKRWYLDPALVGIPAQRHIGAGPVWQVEVGDRRAVREMVLVDADTGAIAMQWHLIHTAAADQRICDDNNKASADSAGPDCDGPYARSNAGVDDVDKAFDHTTVAATYFQKRLGVDLSALLGQAVGGDGKRLRSTVRFCDPESLCATNQGVLFDNAFWNGRGMYYGDNWPNALDVVGHELAHGVTERTSKLLYFYQSGAINESMSDVFGELVELTVDDSAPWFIGEDAPLDGGFALRSMNNPPSYFNPDRMRSGYYDTDLFFADNGGVHTNSGVGNKAAFLIADGGTFNGRTINGIGRDATARVFYRALRMLTSGSDYADLAGVLRQACGAVAGSCGEVAKAVAATEMAAQPTGAAAAPEAGFCPSGNRARIFADGFENFSTRTWQLENYWGHITDYARSGRGSIYGAEPDVATSSAAVLNRRIRPPRGVDTFLRFAHQYRLDHSLLDSGAFRRYYDGAILEYRIGSGSWQNASGRSWQHGPGETIQPSRGSSYRGFGGDSRGYISSRVDLTSLANRDLQFRWRVIGDQDVAFDGWTVDDVEFFVCGGAKPSDVERFTLKRKGKNIKVGWAPPVYRGEGGLSKYKVSVKGPGVKGSVNVKASKNKVTLKKIKNKKGKKKKFKAGKKYKVTIQPIAKGGKGPATTDSVKLKKAKKKKR